MVWTEKFSVRIICGSWNLQTHIIFRQCANDANMKMIATGRQTPEMTSSIDAAISLSKLIGNRHWSHKIHIILMQFLQVILWNTRPEVKSCSNYIQRPRNLKGKPAILFSDEVNRSCGFSTRSTADENQATKLSRCCQVSADTRATDLECWRLTAAFLLLSYNFPKTVR